LTSLSSGNALENASCIETGVAGVEIDADASGIFMGDEPQASKIKTRSAKMYVRRIAD
jgi:hypothetical protein